MACYVVWGVAPLYFVWVDFAQPLEILAHRVVWSVVLLAALISLRGIWRQVAQLGLRQLAWLLLSSVLIATNWGVFIWAVVNDKVIETSLGYFVSPLLSVVLGVLVLSERLRPWQWLAVGIAALGVLHEAAAQNNPPWLGLSLAASFGLYSLVRKRVVVDPVVGLGVESALMVPIAVVYLVLSTAPGVQEHLQQPAAVGMLAVGGLVTVVPLLLFGAALNRLPLTLLSFVQYLAPTLSLLLAVYLLGEPWRDGHWITFGAIWLGLVVFSLDGLRVQQRPAS